MSALAKYLAKVQQMAGDVGRAGTGLAAIGGLKGLEMAQEHPKVTAGLAGAGGLAALLGLTSGAGSGKGDPDEEMALMREKYQGTPYESSVLGDDDGTNDALAMRHRQRRGGI